MLDHYIKTIKLYFINCIHIVLVSIDDDYLLLIYQFVQSLLSSQRNSVIVIHNFKKLDDVSKILWNKN
jgi:hypothetical protein